MRLESDGMAVLEKAATEEREVSEGDADCMADELTERIPGAA
jgi:hypothetical protein